MQKGLSLLLDPSTQKPLFFCWEICFITKKYNYAQHRYTNKKFHNYKSSNEFILFKIVLFKKCINTTNHKIPTNDKTNRILDNFSFCLMFYLEDWQTHPTHPFKQLSKWGHFDLRKHLKSKIQNILFTVYLLFSNVSLQPNTQ